MSIKYVILDIETTGVESKTPNDILMISFVVEDTSNLLPVEELPHLTCFVKHDKIVGEAYALSMNSWILDIISGRKPNTTGYPIYKSYDGVRFSWVDEVLNFLYQHFDPKETITLAGKNVANFDYNFLPKVLQKRFKSRMLDPGSLFVDFSKDTCLPSLSECKVRAGLDSNVAHDSYQDCLDVIKVLRTKYTK